MMKSSRQQASAIRKKRRVTGITLVELLVVIVIVVILAGLAFPGGGGVQTKSGQAKDLSNAKQIGLGLRLYAADHNGVFPTSATSANAAYLHIVPDYVPTQKIFWLANSVWSTGSHAIEFSSSGTLAAGQNNYAYVSGLKDSDNANYPLIADGFNEGVPGVYNSVQGTKGGVYKGRKAIVVRVDDSAAIESVGSDYRVHANGANTDNSSVDIFTTGATWMPWARVLNPE